jgi:hypothetical protein
MIPITQSPVDVAMAPNGMLFVICDRRFFFVVYLEDIQWGDEGSPDFKDLDIRVLTYIQSGSDLEVGVVIGDVGSHAVGTASTAGGEEEEKVRVGGSIPGVLDICFLD